jgi:hypothetical protein
MDEDGCLGRQRFRGVGACSIKVVAQDGGRVGAKWHLQRAPEEIYATAGERWGAPGYRPNFDGP